MRQRRRTTTIAAAESPSPPLLTREFITLALSTMAFFAAMGAANPVLPRFVSDDLGGGETEVGVVVGAFAISSLLLRPYFGRLGDRHGARLLMIVGCIIGAVGFLGYTLVGSVPGAIGARLPLGAAQAAVMTGSTTLAIDLAPDERRGEAASYILVSFHFGLGLGPLLGELVLELSSFDGVWLALSAMMLLGAVIAAVLPRRPGGVSGEPGPLLHPQGVAPGVVIGLAMMAFIAFSTFVPLYGEEVGVERVGPVFMVSSVTIAVVRIAFSKVPDRLGPINSTSIALALIASGCVVLAGWQAPGGLYLGAAILAGGGALAMPALVPAAVEGVAPNHRSSAMATFSMFIDVAVAITGPLFGLVVAGAGYRTAFISALGSTLLAWLVLRFVLAPQLARRRPAGARVTSVS